MVYTSLSNMLVSIFSYKERYPHSEIIMSIEPSRNIKNYMIGYQSMDDDPASWSISVSDSQNSCWRPWELNITSGYVESPHTKEIVDWSGLHNLEEVHNHIKSCHSCLPDFILNE